MPTLSLADLTRIESAGLNASTPPQQRVLDGWLLRFSPGKSKRARCINALSVGRLPLADKVVLCQQAYAEANLPMIVRITPFSQPTQLDETLADMGLRRFDDTRVMVLPDTLSLGEAPTRVEATLRPTPGPAFAEAIGALRGSPASQRQAHAERLAHSPVPYRGFVFEQDGEALACGQTVVEGDMVGLYDVFTTAAARGRGVAHALCHALLQRARDEEGVRVAYLQVDRGNLPARTVYHRLGFTDAYAYHYRTRDLEAA